MLLMDGLTGFALLLEVQISGIETQRRKAEFSLFVRPGSADPASLDSVRSSKHLSPRPSRQPG
jgi:hypothetical protein